jgi:hypothetical protein
MPGFNHRAYAEAAISYAVRHKLEENWEAMIRNMDIAFMHGEDEVEEVFERVGIHMTKNNEFYEWVKTLNYLDRKERCELNVLLGLVSQFQVDNDSVMENYATRWLRGNDKEKFLQFVELEQMFTKMGFSNDRI